MFDFCFTFPYAGLLAVGGLMGYIKKKSTMSLAMGVGSASLLAILAFISLQYYNRGQLCKASTATQLVITGGITAAMWKRYSASFRFMPAGLVFFLSAGMCAFYLWNLLAGPKPKAPAKYT